MEHRSSSFKTQVAGQNSLDEASSKTDINNARETIRSSHKSEKLQSFTTTNCGKQITFGSEKKGSGSRKKQERVSPLGSSSCIADYARSNIIPPTTSSSNSTSLQEEEEEDGEEEYNKDPPQHHLSEQTKQQHQGNEKSFATPSSNTNDTNEYFTKFGKQNKSLVGKKVLEATFKEGNLNYANKLAREDTSCSVKTLTCNDHLFATNKNTLPLDTIKDTSTTTTTSAAVESNSDQDNDIKCKCCNIKSAPNLYNCLPDEQPPNKAACPWCSTKKSHSFANHSSFGELTSGQNVCCNCCCGCPVPKSIFQPDSLERGHKMTSE